jgi:HEAT repeat protein
MTLIHSFCGFYIIYDSILFRCTTRRCLRHEAPSVREAATRVLGNFAERGDIRAIDYILPLIDHHMAYVRYACIIALMNLGVPVCTAWNAH